MSGALTAQLSAIIDLCDAALGEVGRRQHRWAWLRPPGTPIDDCLVVDAYYPHSRLVVCDALRDPEELALCRELIPAHGLRLMEVDATERERLVDLGSVRAALARLAPPPEITVDHGAGVSRRRAETQPAPWGGARSAEWSEAQPGDWGAARPPVRSDPAALRRSGLLLGGALVIVLAFELFVIAIPLTLNGHPLLGIAFLFEALARALGTITAARASDRTLAWSALLIGSPAVLSFTLLAERDQPPPEPGELAGVVAALAVALIALALVGMLLGI